MEIKHLIFIVLMAGMVACKKEPAKYCPVMMAQRTAPHLVDLSPVSHITQIMDTLSKYPQLQAYRVRFSWDHDPGSYSANVFCNIYFKDLIIFDEGYYLYWNSYGSASQLNKLYPIPTALTISTEPAITVEKAIAIAEKTIVFKNCQVTQLGLKNMATAIRPEYKLTWRVTAVEGGYPVVDIDAQDGTVYRVNDGIEN